MMMKRKPAGKKAAAKKPAAKKKSGKMPTELLERFKSKSAASKGKAMTGKETKPEPIKSRDAANRPTKEQPSSTGKRADKSKLAMERGRKRMSKAADLKAEGKTKRAAKKTASGRKAINNSTRLSKPAIRPKKKSGTREMVESYSGPRPTEK